jgi:hypothetical protein
VGHVYQQRYKSVPIQDDEHFFVVCRYVERNALRSWPCVQSRGLAMALSLALAAIARTHAEAAFTMAHAAMAELGGSRQRTAHRR